MFDFNKWMDGIAADKYKNLSRNEIERRLHKLENETGNGRDTFTGIMKRQEQIQREQFGFDVDDLDLTEIATEVMKSQQYLQDEITEVLTALGGAHGKAAWKHWKADHAKCKKMKLDDLSEAEFDEVIGEVADVMIFAMNLSVQCGVNGYDLAHAITEKQGINVERQKTGY